jgi:hypothetical protein
MGPIILNAGICKVMLLLIMLLFIILHLLAQDSSRTATNLLASIIGYKHAKQTKKYN